MATHEEMTELFGVDRVVTLDRAVADEHGVSGGDADVLCDVGMPVFVDVLFTLDTADEGPDPFTVVPVSAGGKENRILVLGGPTDDPELRYCLDMERGYVILMSFGEQPQAEIVNRTLADFDEFLYRFALRTKHLEHAPPQDRTQYTEKLVEYLRARDKYAFAQPDSWWSMVFEQVG
ncbi:MULTISPECIES: SUKH-4 family immunity protein [unclassified Streptomyces]|uniref:SUKH-4 family immunity protein n=1 Tax=unclassified Streptomyces TaxID=2593676 RepID=UPI002E179296